MPAGDAFEDVWRRESPHVLAALLRVRADLAACEDAAQEAAEAAVRQWPRDGTPHDPRGWLIRVAQRRLIDRWRSEAARARREEADARRATAAEVSSADDTVDLLLLCAHPALSRPSQVALALRAVAGLGVERIAAVYLVPPRTMTQRLTRARAALRDAGATFPVPFGAELPGRVAAALDVCHLMFTAGYTRSSGTDLLDDELTAEALRLTRRMVAAFPDHDEAAGALALMLLTDARAPARVDARGDLVPLAEQDRSRWRRDAIDEGVAILEELLPRGHVGTFALQAAIAAVHAEADTYDDTDWAQIVVLYRMLERVAPSATVALNHAVAVGMAYGPEAGLALLARLDDDRALRDGHRLPAARAHLSELAGRTDDAAAAYRIAAARTASLPEQRYLNRRLRDLGA